MRQVLKLVWNSTIWLALAILFAASQLQADEITGITSAQTDQGIIVTVDADVPLTYEKRVDYAEWLYLVDFPGLALSPAVQAPVYEFPEELAEWVSSYRLEATPAGARLVLVLGERAAPLSISLNSRENALIIGLPTSEGQPDNLILVPLGFKDPPVSFWELSQSGSSYRVIPLEALPASGALPAEVKPESRPVSPQSAAPSPAPMSTAEALLPRDGQPKVEAAEGAPAAGHSYSFNDFVLGVRKPAGESASSPASPTPRVYTYSDFMVRAAAEPTTVEGELAPEEEAKADAPAEPDASPLLEYLSEEQLRELAEKPGESIIQSDAAEQVELPPAAPESTVSSELPATEAPAPSWVTPEERRAEDEAVGEAWESPYPWDVNRPRGNRRALPEKSYLEMPLIERERVTFESVDAPLRQAITLMVASTPFNVIVDDQVSEAKVTLSFRDTPLKEALETLTAANDLAYTLVHNTIIVGMRTDIGRRLGGYITRAFQLDYADAEAVKQVLIDNGLVNKENVGVYNGEKGSLDVKTGGTSLSEGASGITAGDIRSIENLVSTARRNTLIVTETSERMKVIEQVIRDIDRRPMQVTLETSIVEINENGLRNLGFEIPDSISTNISEQAGPGEGGGIPLGLWMQTLYRDPYSVALKLNTQIQCGNARILSRPNLAAVDGAQAIYFAGRLIPYITQPAVSAGATFTPPQVDFQAVGITLSFKPRVDRSGDITIDVNPSVSTLLQFMDLGGGAVAPETQTRQVTTTIRVRNQETFVIAGLLNEEEKERLRKVPLLGDVPLFGELFSAREKSRDRSEIMVFVTPIIHE